MVNLALEEFLEKVTQPGLSKDELWALYSGYCDWCSQIREPKHYKCLKLLQPHLQPDYKERYFEFVDAIASRKHIVTWLFYGMNDDTVVTPNILRLVCLAHLICQHLAYNLNDRLMLNVMSIDNAENIRKNIQRTINNMDKKASREFIHLIDSLKLGKPLNTYIYE